MKMNKCLSFHEFGAPEDVLQLESQEILSIKEGEVLLRHLMAPINPSDIGSINGSYGDLKNLPAVPGREGVAEVVEVVEVSGKNILIKKGEKVLIPQAVGSWQQYSFMDADQLIVAPNTIEDEQLAMMSINPPTAWCLLNECVKLNKGDWIIQNAGTSAVGILVIQLAKYLGYKTISIVQNEESVEYLKNEIEADIVLTEDAQYYKNIEAYTNGEPVRLALNSVGGDSALNLVKCLSNDGVHITFGGMTGQSIRFPTRYLIFKNITMKGFWLKQWLESKKWEEVIALYEKLFKLFNDKILKIPVAGVYDLSEYKKALEHVSNRGRNGKILLKL